MRTFRKICAAIYLVAAIAALGGFAALLFSPVGESLGQELSASFPLRVFMGICLCIAGVGALGLTIALFSQKAEVASLALAGEKNIEVSLSALKSCVLAALATEEDVMVEKVDARVQSSDCSFAQVRVDAIALTDKDLASLGGRLQEKIESACTAFVGSDVVSCRVRFLPSRTTTHTQEVSGE